MRIRVSLLTDQESNLLDDKIVANRVIFHNPFIQFLEVKFVVREIDLCSLMSLGLPRLFDVSWSKEDECTALAHGIQLMSCWPTATIHAPDPSDERLKNPISSCRRTPSNGTRAQLGLAEMQMISSIIRIRLGGWGHDGETCLNSHSLVRQSQIESQVESLMHLLYEGRVAPYN